ncbi:MAG: sulfate ABC transporter permease subunit CysT [Planctomycetaceae bacterium]|nr:sulfate ABC transporter permease subunit CysT [Planctomycetaceae bacterium]
MQFHLKQRSVLPGFGLTMGMTLLYLSLLVLLPLAGLAVKSAAIPWAEFYDVVTDPRAVDSYKLTFGASLIGASVNAVFGLIVAWVLVRYPFPGRNLLDAMVDLPFAMPTAVSGIALTTIYAENGWIGRWLHEWFGLKVAYTPLGVMVALTFIGLPFVVRTLQPALEDLDREVEESAASLGASRWQTFRRVIFPTILPSLLTGFALAFARALGEYGSVVFIAGTGRNVEIVSLLIMTKLEQFDYVEAAAIAVVALSASFAVLLFINILQWWSRRYAVS